MIDNLGLDSLSDDRWIDHACDRFEIAWRGGQPLSIESVLAAYPDRLRERILFELIAIEIYWRRKNGEKPIVGEYSSRFMSLEFRGLSELIE